MKNVFNLISKAFTAINHYEEDYIIKIQDNYKITITKNNQQGIATLKLILNNYSELLDFQEYNDLFINRDWDRFCDIFEYEINPPMTNTNAVTNTNAIANVFITANDLLRRLSTINNRPPPLEIPPNGFINDEFDDMPPPLVRPDARFMEEESDNYDDMPPLVRPDGRFIHEAEEESINYDIMPPPLIPLAGGFINLDEYNNQSFYNHTNDDNDDNISDISSIDFNYESE